MTSYSFRTEMVAFDAQYVHAYSMQIELMFGKFYSSVVWC